MKRLSSKDENMDVVIYILAGASVLLFFALVGLKISIRQLEIKRLKHEARVDFILRNKLSVMEIREFYCLLDSKNRRLK